MSGSRGIPYFFNPATGETRWDAPPGEAVRVVDSARRDRDHAASSSKAARTESEQAGPEKQAHGNTPANTANGPPKPAPKTEADPASKASSLPLPKPTNAPPPTAPSAPQALPPNSVHAFHLLVKHAGVRRPSSWREERITRTVPQATALVESYRREIEAAAEAGGTEAALGRLRDLAGRFSDCSSAKRGGDLGVFGRGQMQRAFEDAAFALPVGRVSTPVVTDSGVHLIFVVARSD